MTENLHDENNSSRNVLHEVEEYLEEGDPIERKSFHGCILFADLVGSTEYKRYHGIIKGLAKTVQHNNVAVQCIKNRGGKIVKFIGDEVMGLFEGENCEFDALQTGLDIISGIYQANCQRKWYHYPHSMSTKIGIHSGKLWSFMYLNEVEDPQGTTVDIAARLVSLAGPNQIVCVDETYEKAIARGFVKKPIKSFPRYLKGIKEKQQINIIMQNDNEYIDENSNTDLDNQLDEAFRLLNEGHGKPAYNKLRAIITEYTDNFQAHASLAESMLKELNGHIDISHESLQLLKDYLDKAIGSRPCNCRNWILRGWFYHICYENKKDVSFLNKAIDCVEKADCIARRCLDTAGSLQARVCLVSFLVDLYKHSQNPSDLKEADSICVHMNHQIETYFNEVKSDFYVAYGAIKRLSGENYNIILEMLTKAKGLNPRNARALKEEEALLRQCHPNGGVGATLGLKALG